MRNNLRLSDLDYDELITDLAEDEDNRNLIGVRRSLIDTHCMGDINMFSSEELDEFLKA